MKVTVVIACRFQNSTLSHAKASAESQVDEVITSQDNATVRQGVCFTRNKAIWEADTALILPLDADEILLPGAVDALLSAYTPGTFVYGNWIERRTERKPAPIGMIDRKNIACSTFLFEREAWLKVGGYNPRYEIGGEDWAFMCALLNAGYQPHYVDALIHTYTPTPGGRSHKMLPYIDTIRAMLNEDYAAGLQFAKRGLQKTI